MSHGEQAFVETADTLVTHLEAIHASDKATERAAKGWTIGCFAFLALGVFGSGAVFVLVGDEPRYLWPLIVVTVLGIGLCAVQMNRYNKRDLDDRKVEAALKLVKVLRADVPPTSRVELRVDFRDYQKGRLVQKQDRRFRYEHPWLRVSAPLADGTVAHLRLTDHVSRREKPKRKYTKVKERWHSDVDVRLHLARAYGPAEPLAQKLQQQPPPPRLQLLGVRGSGRALQTSVRTFPALRVTGRGTPDPLPTVGTADTVLQSLRWTYRALAPGR